MTDQDHSYKHLFSHPRMVEDLLRGFVREAWVQQLDFSTLDKVSGSYVSDDLREREDDVIWRVRWGQDWLYVYLLLDEGRYREAELPPLQNLVAAVFRLENSRAPEDLLKILTALIGELSGVN